MIDMCSAATCGVGIIFMRLQPLVIAAPYLEHSSSTIQQAGIMGLAALEAGKVFQSLILLAALMLIVLVTILAHTPKWFATALNRDAACMIQVICIIAKLKVLVLTMVIVMMDIAV